MINEAEGRLRSYLGDEQTLRGPHGEPIRPIDLLDEALADERRATVERIRPKVKRSAVNSARQFVEADIDAILDAEAK